MTGYAEATLPMHSRLLGKTLRLQSVPMPGLDEDAWATVSPVQPSIKKVAALDSPVFSEEAGGAVRRLTASPSLAAAGSLSDISSAQDGFNYMRATQPDGSSSESDAFYTNVLFKGNRTAADNGSPSEVTSVMTLPEQPRGVPIVRISQGMAPGVMQPSQGDARNHTRTRTTSSSGYHGPVLDGSMYDLTDDDITTASGTHGAWSSTATSRRPTQYTMDSSTGGARRSRFATMTRSTTGGDALIVPEPSVITTQAGVAAYKQQTSAGGRSSTDQAKSTAGSAAVSAAGAGPASEITLGSISLGAGSTVGGHHDADCGNLSSSSSDDNGAAGRSSKRASLGGSHKRLPAAASLAAGEGSGARGGSKSAGGLLHPRPPAASAERRQVQIAAGAGRSTDVVLGSVHQAGNTAVPASLPPGAGAIVWPGPGHANDAQQGDGSVKTKRTRSRRERETYTGSKSSRSISSFSSQAGGSAALAGGHLEGQSAGGSLLDVAGRFTASTASGRSSKTPSVNGTVSVSAGGVSAISSAGGRGIGSGAASQRQSSAGGSFVDPAPGAPWTLRVSSSKGSSDGVAATGTSRSAEMTRSTAGGRQSTRDTAGGMRSTAGGHSIQGRSLIGSAATSAGGVAMAALGGAASAPVTVPSGQQYSSTRGAGTGGGVGSEGGRPASTFSLPGSETHARLRSLAGAGETSQAGTRNPSAAGGQASACGDSWGDSDETAGSATGAVVAAYAAMAADGGCDDHSWGATTPSEQPEQAEELAVPDTPPQAQHSLHFIEQQQQQLPNRAAAVHHNSSGGGGHTDEFRNALANAASEQALRKAGYARPAAPRSGDGGIEGQGIDSFTGLPRGMLPAGSDGGGAQQSHFRGLVTRSSRESGSHTTEMMSLSAFTPYQQPGSPGDAEQYREAGGEAVHSGGGRALPPGVTRLLGGSSSGAHPIQQLMEGRQGGGGGGGDEERSSKRSSKGLRHGPGSGRHSAQGSGGYALRLPGSNAESGDGDDEYEGGDTEGLSMYQRGSRLQGGLLASDTGTDHLVSYAPPPQPPKRTCRLCCAWFMTWLFPSGLGGQRTPWTLGYTAIVLVTFFFMAGQFASWEAAMGPDDAEPVSSLDGLLGPRELGQWLRFWQRGSRQRSFSLDYLITWGARWGPGLASHQGWRWFTPLILHQSFSHLLSNLVVLVVVSTEMERQHGTLLAAAAFILSGVGGLMSSAVFENACTSAVVGSTAGVFGVCGLFLIDILITFRGLWWAAARCLILSISLALIVATQVSFDSNSQHISHLAHGLGFAAGACLGALILPAAAAVGRRPLPPSAPRPLLHPSTRYAIPDGISEGGDGSEDPEAGFGRNRKLRCCSALSESWWCCCCAAGEQPGSRLGAAGAWGPTGESESAPAGSGYQSHFHGVTSPSVTPGQSHSRPHGCCRVMCSLRCGHQGQSLLIPCCEEAPCGFLGPSSALCGTTAVHRPQLQYSTQQQRYRWGWGWGAETAWSCLACWRAMWLRARLVFLMLQVLALLVLLAELVGAPLYVHLSKLQNLSCE